MIRIPVRPLVAAVLIAGSAPAALASSSRAPIKYDPDPALKTASRSDIEGRFRRSCQATQAKLQGLDESAVSRPCGCYASRTLRSLDKVELASYRETGVFDDTARGKALAAIDACKLKRPS
jgi:hypothetical protein